MLKYLSENIINIEDFKEFDTENKKEIETLKKQISNIEEQIKNKENQHSDYNVWLEKGTLSIYQSVYMADLNVYR